MELTKPRRSVGKGKVPIVYFVLITITIILLYKLEGHTLYYILFMVNILRIHAMNKILYSYKSQYLI